MRGRLIRDLRRCIGTLAGLVGLLAIVGVIAAMASCVLGCAHPLTGAVVALNASAAVGDATEPVLAASYERASERCLETPPTAVECVLGVRARYRPAWSAYDAMRAAWVAAAALVRAAEADGARVPETLAAVARLVEAQRAMAAAVTEVTR